jgi:hypothetical protein
MGNRLKFLIVLTLIALLPLRALAAVTVGLCAIGHQDAAVQVVSDHAHAHDSSHHDNGAAPEPQTGATPGCNVCAEHCTSAACVVPIEPTALPVSTGSDRIPHGERVAAGFIPEHLDPPPLAL